MRVVGWSLSFSALYFTFIVDPAEFFPPPRLPCVTVLLESLQPSVFLLSSRPRDVKFIFDEVVNVWKTFPEAVAQDTVEIIIKECAKFAETTLNPIYQVP